MTSNEMAELRRSRLIELLDKKSISRAELAARVGFSRAYSSNLLTKGKPFGEKAARKIERALFVQDNYLDEPQSGLKAVESWTTPDDLEPGAFALVPRLEIKLSGGTGTVYVSEQLLPPLAFREEWLHKMRVTSRSNLRICGVIGRSMEPYISDGDIVMVDTGQTTVSDGSVYAIRFGDELRIKRLFRRPDGSIRIHSENTSFPDELITERDAEHFQVIGLVLWRAGGL